MVGENFEIYLSQMAIYTIKLSTMVGENFEIYLSQMAIYTIKLSTMVGENFEIYFSRMAINDPINTPPNCPPPWLEKILTFTVIFSDWIFYDFFMSKSGIL